MDDALDFSDDIPRGPFRGTLYYLIYIPSFATPGHLSPSFVVHRHPLAMSVAHPNFEKPSDEFVETAGHPNRPAIAVTGFSQEEEAALTKSLLRKLDTRMLPMLAVLFLFSFLDRQVRVCHKLVHHADHVQNQYREREDSGSHKGSKSLAQAIFELSSHFFRLLHRIRSALKPRHQEILASSLARNPHRGMGRGRHGHGIRQELHRSNGRSSFPWYDRRWSPTRNCSLLVHDVQAKRDRFQIGPDIFCGLSVWSFRWLTCDWPPRHRQAGVSDIYPFCPSLHVRGIDGWRWILIIEGIMTVLIGVLACFVLPSTVDKASFLTHEESTVAQSRLLNDKPFHLDASGAPEFNQDPFEWRRVWMAVFSIRTWLSALAYLAILTALYSFGLFQPTIIQGLGYTAVRAQLFSVPPYAAGAVLTVVASWISDKYKVRGPVMLCFLPLAISGYAIIANTTNLHAKYAALFLIAMGLYPSVPPVLVWLSSNYTNHYTRATAIGLQLAIANCGGFPASFIYEAKQAPRYYKAHTIVMSMLSVAWVLVALKCAFLHYLNRQKATGKMDKYRGCGDDRDPDFKYII